MNPSSLFDKPLAIVDVETTGGNPASSRVIDIAILRVENGKIVRKLVTTLDPEAYIPAQILAMTGISEAELKKSPSFNDISRDVIDILDGCIFIAHNARFDYGFIKQELARVGYSYTAKCFCTVKLSRKLFPHYKRHDLSSIIDRLGFECSARHRALPDAEVLFDLLGYCAKYCLPEDLKLAVAGILGTSSLPLHISSELIESLPEKPGVYMFYGEDGDILYVGKSVSIKNRVKSHFQGDFKTGKAARMTQEVRDIETIVTPGELSALILESHLIKSKQPLYNRMSRQTKMLVIAEEAVDDAGYKKVELTRANPELLVPDTTVLGLFRSLSQAKKVLQEYANAHAICPKMLGLESGARAGACFYSQLGKCSGACAGKEEADVHNQRFDDVFKERRIKTWPFSGPIKIDEPIAGSESREGVCFVIDNWCLLGSFSYDETGYRPFIDTQSGFDYDTYKILSAHILKAKRKNIQELSSSEYDALSQE